MAELNGTFNTVNSSDRVHDWETGLPNVDDITPLSYGLLSPELLSAFNIKPEPYRTLGDVTQASEKTLSSLRGGSTAAVAAEVEDDGDVDDSRRNVSPEDADSAAAEEEVEDDGEEKAAKRARLVWTPQLHRRFVEVVAHLGIKNAVPKTIMQLMNVEGLTRENVASHLQKYRLYLKRNQGFSFDTVPAPTPTPTPAQITQVQNNQFNYKFSGNNSNSNSNSKNNSQYNNGVMQTGNNMYGSSVGVSYHLNHHHNMQK